jgi:CRISPR-associated endonuclease/helicase Cas3
MNSIDELYRSALATDAQPFEYQRRLAEQGLPELVDVPTGCGKTAGVLLAWVYRRFFHPEPSIRATTPTRLIWCLPLRTLTAQTVELARRWIGALGLDQEVEVHLLMGGEPVGAQGWRLHPQRPAIVVSTLDMALSRALNRGFLAGRYAWPVDFALFNDDCQWVFDEVQLMGVALPTSRQLHGLRTSLGVPTRHRSTWMSATVDRESLLTVDAPEVGDVVALDDADRADPELELRLSAPKTLVRRRLDNPNKAAASFAELIRSEHVAGTMTLVVLNTVKVAQEVARLLRRHGTDDGAGVELIHSRFRPGEREAALDRVLRGTDTGTGLVAVATQVIEAGVDLSARTLITECSPWSSIVQRAGRCNRWGELEEARVVVVSSSGSGPYDAAAVEAAWDAAGRLDGSVVTPGTLAAATVSEPERPMAVLRRKDLLDLYDTAPDLLGNDVDVSRFIRADGELDLAVAWRPLDDLAGKTARVERCPVPITAARKWLKENVGGRARVYDPLEARWRVARLDDIRPGAEVVVDVECGGYSPETGFDPAIKAAVEPVAAADDREPTLDDDRDIGANTLTEIGMPISLADHLLDARDDAARLCDELSVEDAGTRAAICRAARLHDIGKAHQVFQAALHDRSPGVRPEVVLAKSGTKSRLPIDASRLGFRHELASAAMLDAHPDLADGDGIDADLVTYLVGAHHGRIRMSIRSLPTEDEGQALGVRQGDHIDEVDMGEGRVAPPTDVDLSMAGLGGGGSGPSWSARAEDLLARYGPFRLAWMEAMVRIADWRASSRTDRR